MAVSLYFGLPGCGKTTLLCQLAYKALKNPNYKFVYSNIPINIPGVITIDNDCIGRYNLEDCCILIDEATLFADNRDHKNFSRNKIEFFLLHRHYNCDVLLFTQQWNGVDLKIRVITDRVYYVYKGAFTGHWFTKHYRIPYGIVIPDPHDKNSSEKLGEIVQGYCKPSIFVRLFAKWTFRPFYYPYFNSWDRYELEKLPDRYISYVKSTEDGNITTVKELEHYKRLCLVRSVKFSFTEVPGELLTFFYSLFPSGKYSVPESFFKSRKH